MHNQTWSVDMSVPALREPGRESHIAPWQRRLPTLRGKQVVLREPRKSDAASLFPLLTTPEVRRFLYEPPTSVEGFEAFISWSRTERIEGRGVCFAVTIEGFDTAIGLFQVRATGVDLSVADWGFALGSPFWGTGVFVESAELVLQFAFDTLGVHRLEATAAVRSGRANRVLIKLGAVPEGILRESLPRDGQFLDQVLYSLLESDYRASRQAVVLASQVSVH